MVDIAAALDSTVETPAAIAEVPTKEKKAVINFSHTRPMNVADNLVHR
jgi:hypothetical protein